MILRPFVSTDVGDVHQYASDPEVCQYTVFGPNTLNESVEFIQMAAAESKKVPCMNFHFAIILEQQGQLIGAGSLGDISIRNSEAELGYCLNRAYWNMGYATETARALIEFGFGKLDLHRIHAICRPANLASAKVLQKAGMTLEGHLREHRFVRGRWEDSLLYSILENEREYGKEQFIRIEQ